MKEEEAEEEKEKEEEEKEESKKRSRRGKISKRRDPTKYPEGEGPDQKKKIVQEFVGAAMRGD